jgi:hypothetical protein
MARAATFDRIQIAPGEAPTAEQINRVQAAVARTVDALNQRDRLVTVKFVAANTDTRLFHQLGRPFVGARLVRATAALSVYDGALSTDPNNWVNLKSSAIGTATFEVF